MCVFNHASLESFALLSLNTDVELRGWEHSRFPVLHLTATPTRPEVQKMTAQLHASPCLTRGGVLPVSASVSRAPSRRVSN